MYHDREWKHYNQSLINRDKVNFWIHEKAWRVPKKKRMEHLSVCAQRR